MPKLQWARQFMNRQYLQLVIILCLVGILSFGAVGFAHEAKQRESDFQRIIDLQTIQSALQVFYNDYGTYPSAIGHSKNSEGNAIPGLRYERQQKMFPQISTEDDVSMLTTLVYGGYLKEVPQDPDHTAGSHFVYTYHVAGEKTPTGNIPNQYYQLATKFSSVSQQETRAAPSSDGGDDKDDTGDDVYELGNSTGNITISQPDWELMFSQGAINLNTARRTSVLSALGSTIPGKKLDGNTLEGIYW